MNSAFPINQSLDNFSLPLRKVGWNWLFKYKLYHIPFWCVYHYLFWLIAIGNPLQVANTILFSVYSIKFIFAVVFQAIAVYFNLYFLMPRYLEKGRFTEYTIYVLLTVFFAACFFVSGYYLIALISEQSFKELFNVAPEKFSHFFLNGAFPSTIASTTLAMSIKLTKNWVESKRRQQLLENEKLETELKFLKYQYNPHFLFNTINSIFFLIHKNPDRASASLAQFSELLRYQLYECDDKQIPLTKEITYLENFIELAKLRQNANTNVALNIHQSYSDNLGIAPFILMTFIENAFKHVSKHSDKSNWIRISLVIQQSELKFDIANSTAPDASAEVMNYGGIGLKNVQRRLDLIYPGLYSLHIENGDTNFDVRLRLQLSDLPVAEVLPQT